MCGEVREKFERPKGVKIGLAFLKGLIKKLFLYEVLNIGNFRNLGDSKKLTKILGNFQQKKKKKEKKTINFLGGFFYYFFRSA